MSYVDLSGPQTATSREPAQHESRDLEVTAKPRRTAAQREVDRDSSRSAPEAVLAKEDTNAVSEADTLAGCLELGCDLYIFGIGLGTDLVFDGDA